MKTFGNSLFQKGLWMDMPGEVLPIHIRIDANNVCTTAAKTTLPEQKETIHMITALRREACSGAIEDFSHVRTQFQMIDCITKQQASGRCLDKAVEQCTLIGVDQNPSFRKKLQTKHEAYLAYWI